MTGSSPRRRRWCCGHAPDAPGEIHSEAVVRTAGYLFDMPQAGMGAGYADVLRNSGALALMLPWRRHRAGVVDRDTGGDTTTETTTGGVALPGGGVALPGVVVGQPVIVSVGSTPAPGGAAGIPGATSSATAAPQWCSWP